jgi:hypothetical protein
MIFNQPIERGAPALRNLSAAVMPLMMRFSLWVCTFLFVPGFVNAQQPITLTCQQLELLVDTVASAQCDPNSVTDCFRQMYQVRLRTNNFLPLPASTFQLEYCDMGFNLKVITTGSGCSDLDKVICSNAGLDISVDHTKNEIALLATTTPGPSPLLEFVYDPVTQHYYCHLYNFWVHMYPNDVVSLDINNITYVYSTTECIIDPITCSLQSSLATPISWQYPTPNYTDRTLQFGLPALITNGGSNIEEIRVPVEYKGIGGTFFKKLDFYINYNATNSMLVPDVADQTGGMLVEKKITQIGTSTASYTIFLRYENITIPSNNIIALIKVKEPIPASLSADVTLAFNSGRAFYDNVCYNAQIGAPTTVTFPGASQCSNSTNFIVGGGLGSSQCQMYSTFSFSWPVIPPATTANLKILRLKLKYIASPDVKFTNANITGLACPSTPDPIQCPGFTSQCWQYDTTTNVFTICWALPAGGTNIPINTVQFVLQFNSSIGGCIDSVQVQDAYIEVDGQNGCVPTVLISGFPLCFDEVKGKLETAYGNPIVPVCEEIVYVQTGLGVPVGGTQPDLMGDYSLCLSRDTYIVIPKNNLYHLNGVNMLDVLKIQRHILGLDPLSLYKQIAADANTNNSITASDITTLRQLILGGTSMLPNDSWRFVPKSFVFPNPNNAFVSMFPESDTVLTNSGIAADFYGIKIGDVTGEADGCTTQKPGNLVATLLAANMQSARKTERFLTIPIVNEGAITLSALQSAFRFNTSQYRFVGVGTGEQSMVRPTDFNLDKANEGLIKIAWCISLPDQEGLKPGDVLFYITFELISKSSAPKDFEPVLVIAEEVMPCLAFDATDAAYAIVMQAESKLQLRETQHLSEIKVSATPNPVTESLILSLDWERNDKFEVILYDAFGRHVYRQEYQFAPGVHTIKIDGLAKLPSGPYQWLARSRKRYSSGYFIKV